MGRWRRTAAGGVMALGLVAAGSLAGCTSDDEGAAGSPLAEYLGADVLGSGTPTAEEQEELAAEDRAREEAIAACMADKGFEYLPQEPIVVRTTTVDGLEFDSREYAERYGFGITTEYFSQEEVGPDLVGYDVDYLDDIFPDDPNDALLAEMDDLTRARWQVALRGDEPDSPIFDPETMTEEQRSELEAELAASPIGCEGEVVQAELLDQGVDPAFYQAFAPELQQLYTDIAADPRLAEHREEVADCVTDEGIEVTADDLTFDRLYARFADRLLEVDADVGPAPGDDLTDEEYASLSDEEREELLDTPRTFSDDARARLAELQAEETELAVAMWDCGGSPAETEAVQQAVTAEYEQRFIDEYGDELEPFRAG